MLLLWTDYIYIAFIHHKDRQSIKHKKMLLCLCALLVYCWLQIWSSISQTIEPYCHTVRMHASAIIAFSLVMTLTSDLENLFSSFCSHDEYLREVPLRFFHWGKRYREIGVSRWSVARLWQMTEKHNAFAAYFVGGSRTNTTLHVKTKRYHMSQLQSNKWSIIGQCKVYTVDNYLGHTVRECTCDLFKAF